MDRKQKGERVENKKKWKKEWAENKKGNRKKTIFNRDSLLENRFAVLGGFAKGHNLSVLGGFGKGHNLLDSFSLAIFASFNKISTPW